METKNLYLIPTDKPPIKGDLLLRHLWKGKPNECISWWRYNDTSTYGSVVVYTTLNGSFMDSPSSFKTQHIYITNSEEIKEGDFVYSTNEDYNIQKVPSKKSVKAYRDCGHYKKIILTTDVDLIAGGVQGIKDSFLEWFINNPSCEQVETKLINFEVDMELGDSCIEYGSYYEIIIPNDESKQIDENGSPMTFWGGLKNHKKESIEEGAEALAKRRFELDPIYANGLYYGFIECGKSKWFEVEKIKAQIEENLSVLEMLKIHGTESSMIRVKMRIEQLKKMCD